MKTLKIILAVLLVCTAAVAACAEDTMTEYTQGNFVYRVWSDWTTQETEEGNRLFFLDPDEPRSGYLCVQVRQEEYFAGLDAGVKEETLTTLVESMGGEDGLDEPQMVYGKYGNIEGMLFTAKFLGEMDAAGFVTYEGEDLCFFLLADNVSGGEALSGKLQELLGTLEIRKAE